MTDKNNNIVINAVDETHVFVNEGDSITIKQICPMGGNDSVVVIRGCDADILIGALEVAQAEINE